MMSDTVDGACDKVPVGTYTVVLCSGDGAGSMERGGFFTNLKKMKGGGWNVEVLGWQGCCNRYMKKWVEENGFYVPLDDFYWSITYLEPDPNPQGVKPLSPVLFGYMYVRHFTHVHHPFVHAARVLHFSAFISLYFSCLVQLP